MKREDTELLFEAVISFIMYLAFSFKALRMLRAIAPDIINVSTVLQAFIMFSFIKPAKIYITHSHDMYVHDTPYSMLKKLMLKHALSSSDAVVALTNNIKSYLENMGFKINAVIPNAVDPDDYECSEQTDGNYELYSGRLVRHKKVLELLESFSSLQATNPSKLVISGAGPQKKLLTEWVRRKNIQDSVSFFPFLSRADYKRTLAQCSFFVLPSTTEAFGVVIIEAMASGKPVIARRVPGPTDIITHGYDGLLFSNFSELGECRKLLLSNKQLRRQIGRNARGTVVQKYAINKVVNEYEALYKSLMLKHEPMVGKLSQ
jgi:glycosyltransferase involved in cell wall biosynthesis